MKDDALSTTVQGTVLSKAGTAEDVLARIPGLQRKQDGFEVFGKGAPLIYINGRKMRDRTGRESKVLSRFCFSTGETLFQYG